jgi:hypothetical protein
LSSAGTVGKDGLTMRVEVLPARLDAIVDARASAPPP